MGYVMYVTLALSIISMITFSAMMILDRNRGESVSATAPHVMAIRICLGVMIISSAGSLAAYFA